MFKYNMSLIDQGQLALAIDDTETEIRLMPGEGVNYISPPCIGVLARSRSLSDLAQAEHIIMAARDTDTFTVERGAFGTAAEWPVGTLLLGFWSPLHFDAVNSNVDMLEFILNKTVGGGHENVVIFQDDYDFDASAGSGLSVNLTPGACFGNYKLYAKATTTNVTFVAPTTDTRIDLIQADPVNRVISVVTGVEGDPAPSADAGCCPLWQVTTLVGQVTRITGDLADVRPS